MKVGINCGSGQRPFTSTPEVQWINVDVQAKWNPDIVCDGAQLPYEDERADYFVLHHTLEHYGCGDGLPLIREAYRVLKNGGSLLVFVPDMLALAQRWARGGISTQIYMTNVYGAYAGHEADRHKWGFDYAHLESFVKQLPWKLAGHFNDRIIPGADIARDWWILGMECVK